MTKPKYEPGMVICWNYADQPARSDIVSLVKEVYESQLLLQHLADNGNYTMLDKAMVKRILGKLVPVEQQ